MFSMRMCAKGFIKSVLVTMNGFCIILAICLVGVTLTNIQIVQKYADEGTMSTLAANAVVLAVCLLLICVVGFGCFGANILAICLVGITLTDIQIVQKYADEGTMSTLAANAVVLAVCLLLICVAGFGCFGAIKENEKYLYLYTVLLVVMVVLELMLAVMMAVQRYGLEMRVVDWLRTDFYKNVTAEEADEHRAQWDRLQYTFECCGVEGPEDYTAIGLPVSLSCCRTAYGLKNHQGRQQHYDLCLKNKSYEEDGCEDEILYSLRESGDCLFCIALIALMFEGSGMIMAMWLTNYLRNQVNIYKETLRY